MKNVILVTGGAGYIGSQLIRDFAAHSEFRASTIRIYDNLQRNNYAALMDLPAGMHYEFIEGDILDRFTLRDALQGVHTVIHLAAIVTTPISFDHPSWTHQVNHWGTATVVDEALTAGAQRLIYACSSSVYGPGGAFREEDVCTPIGPYSVAKLQGEQAVFSAGKARGLNVTSLRLGNVFGFAPGIRFEAVVNRFAYMAGTGKPVIIHGDGGQKRPVLHIRDATSAIFFCLQNNATVGEIFNVAAQNISVLDVVEMLRAELPDLAVRYTGQDALTSLSFETNGDKFHALGWMPQYSLHDGIQEILARLSALRSEA
jgi:UDP-glucose 4-epimerase